jgi:putative ABC transport system permease protein
MIWLCSGLIVAVLFAFSLSQSQRWSIGLALTAGLGAAFALLFGVAHVLMRLLRSQTGRVGSFVIRQGLASLYRPHNRTILLMLSLGLGTFLILTLYLLQTNLVRNILPSVQDARPDTILFDIQTDQKEDVIRMLRSEDLPVLEEVPVVTMRLASVKGRGVDEIRKDPHHTAPNWALRREYRSTYREYLVDSEKLVGGSWQGRVPKDATPVPISIEDGIAKSLGVGLGDELTFDVQGVAVKAVVASLREVDWRRVQPNFFIVFPMGVLEDAPAFHVLTTRASSSGKSAELQRSLVKHFPNVSTIDLSLVLQTLDGILRKITFVVRFMALFTVGTGLLVLAASILTGRYQRVQESVLLRTLGASRRQIWRILLVEYISLGVLAAVTGIILATMASWALARFVFHIGYGLPVMPLFLATLIVSALTVMTGLIASRGVCNHPPLEVLRNEL